MALRDKDLYAGSLFVSNSININGRVINAYIFDRLLARVDSLERPADSDLEGLRAQVAALALQVASLTTQNAALTAQVTALAATVAANDEDYRAFKACVLQNTELVPSG